MTSSDASHVYPKCDVCCSSEPILNCDTVHQIETISAHYFCLLFSSGLGQRGEEREGVKGFLAGDIRREVRRGARLKCVYCRKKGATVGCAEQRCKKSYHPNCGKKHNSLFQFFDQFKSFCKEHRPVQTVRKVEGRSGNNSCSTCTICQDRIVRKATLKTLWSPCCSSFFHRDCVQTMAVSAGKEHLRCPNCNDTEAFLLEMKEVGIYVPEQDASWEYKGNYDDVDGERVTACHAKLCFCPHTDGRVYHSEGGLWEVVVCDNCGSKGIHSGCGGMEDIPDPVWHCYTCREGLRVRGEEQTYLQHTSKLWPKREEVFSSSFNQCSLSPSSTTTSCPPSPNPLLSALLATLPPLEEKTFTKLVIPVVRQKAASPAKMSTSVPPPTTQQNVNTRTVLTRINSKTSFTDLLGSMLDTEDGSPGDSDYESSQDIGLGVKQTAPQPLQYPETARKKAVMLLSKQVLKPAWLREQYTRLAKLYCTGSKQQVDKLAFKSQRLKALKDVEKYPHKFCASADVKQVLEKFSIIKSGEKYEEHLSICGMVTNIREMSKKLKFVDLEGGGHKIQLKLSSVSYHSSQDFINDSNNISKGDRIGVTGYPIRTKSGELSVLVEKLTMLAPCLRQLPSSGFEVSQKRFRKRYLDFMINKSSRDVIVTRSKIIKYLRNFLEDRGFLEVETPILGTSVGGAAARPFITLHNDMEQELVMRVAPELYLKQMVVGGFDRVFEIGKQFRNEGVDHSHNPEFTSCEFYQAYVDYNDLMEMTEDLLMSMVEELGLEPKHKGKDIHFQKPFTRLAFIPSLESACGTTFPSSSELDSVDSFKFLQSMCTKHGVQVGNFVTIPRMLDKLVGRLVEPELIQPTYLVHHPKVMSPLAKEHREVEGLAERFELFIGGKEVANAYTELNNPEEQRAMLISQATMEDPEGMVPDEDYCISLEYGLPPTAGWGCGLDRLVMILCNQDHIRDTITFPLQKQF